MSTVYEATTLDDVVDVDAVEWGIRQQIAVIRREQLALERRSNTEGAQSMRLIERGLFMALSTLTGVASEVLRNDFARDWYSRLDGIPTQRMFASATLYDGVDVRVGEVLRAISPTDQEGGTIADAARVMARLGFYDVAVLPDVLDDGAAQAHRDRWSA